MIPLIASPYGFVITLMFFACGAVISLSLRHSDGRANLASAVFSIAGSACGIVFATAAFLYHCDLSFGHFSGVFPFLTLSFHLDGLSLFFTFVISIITLPCSLYGFGYVKQYYGKYDIGALGFFYNLFIFGMLTAVTADNGLFFLMAWEIMSIASFFLVIYDHHDPAGVRAGYVYLLMTHVATACIILALLLLYKYAGSFNFSTIRAASAAIPLSAKNAIFIFSIIGFGTKAGIIPFHIWLPRAHPAAPSHVSALMSGVMIKTGIYMMIRVFMDLLQPIPLWWGLTILILGSLSSLLGVLYALTEHDLKKLLACHSIENIGIILLGVGGSLSFLSLGMPALSLLSLMAALFHTLNHATFKSLLFLGAGSVISQTHTRSMEKFGGLIKCMPLTALFFLIGSMAISALPPFNGFFSEWMTFQSLFKGISELINFSAKWVFIVSAAALAFTGGLALACFVKAFATTFLARPRHKDFASLKESSLVFQLAMGGLAALSLLLGIFSGPVVLVLDRICRSLHCLQNAPTTAAVFSFQGIGVSGFSFVSAPLIAVLFLGVFCMVFFAARRLINPGQKTRIGRTWDCGSDLTTRMEINSTGVARSLITIFKRVLKPSIQHETEYHDNESRYLPKSRSVTLHLKDLHLSYLYKPLRALIAVLSARVSVIQSGNINMYILYIFIALLAALTLVK